MRALALLSLLLLAAFPPLACWADDTDPEPPDGDRNALVGEWEVVRIKHQGNEIQLPGNVVQITVTFERNGTVSMNTMGKAQKGKWKVDGTKKPKHLDMTVDNKAAPGIYKLEKGELTISAGEPGQARPKDFETAPAALILKRKAK